MLTYVLARGWDGAAMAHRVGYSASRQSSRRWVIVRFVTDHSRAKEVAGGVTMRFVTVHFPHGDIVVNGKLITSFCAVFRLFPYTKTTGYQDGLRRHQEAR